MRTCGTRPVHRRRPRGARDAVRGWIAIARGGTSMCRRAPRRPTSMVSGPEPLDPSRWIRAGRAEPVDLSREDRGGWIRVDGPRPRTRCGASRRKVAPGPGGGRRRLQRCQRPHGRGVAFQDPGPSPPVTTLALEASNGVASACAYPSFRAPWCRSGLCRSVRDGGELWGLGRSGHGPSNHDVRPQDGQGLQTPCTGRGDR